MSGADKRGSKAKGIHIEIVYARQVYGKFDTKS